jgi:dihydrofolate reductase
MRLNLIFARSRNGVIGKNNALPWHLPEDLAHFKRMTQGCPVIMGRKTWDSLPPRFRPLPGRTNIVLTRGFIDQIGLLPASNIDSSLQLCEQLTPQPTEIWVIGGAQIYQATVALARRVVVTEIDQDFEGDAFAPVLGPEWQETQREAHQTAAGLRYSFVTLERR